ncbi:hypothetical protein C8Q80DRAFT_561806 [Daedaleopsis nitida]|nr:hypothetical protein C8Q80DRAFT_561806 [Daedaleopsis nitida]
MVGDNRDGGERDGERRGGRWAGGRAPLAFDFSRLPVRIPTGRQRASRAVARSGRRLAQSSRPAGHGTLFAKRLYYTPCLRGSFSASCSARPPAGAFSSTSRPAHLGPGGRHPRDPDRCDVMSRLCSCMVCPLPQLYRAVIPVKDALASTDMPVHDPTSLPSTLGLVDRFTNGHRGYQPVRCTSVSHTQALLQFANRFAPSTRRRAALVVHMAINYRPHQITAAD